MAGIIVDSGSEIMKAGFQGEDVRSTWPNIVGRPRHPGIFLPPLKKYQDAVVGHEDHIKRGILTNKYPMENGVVINWDDMDKMWHYTFHHELRIDPAEHPGLFAISPRADSQRTKMTEMMFEMFNFPAISLQPQPLLSTIAGGRTTSLAIDIGTQSTCVPIYEGHALMHFMQLCPVGGRDLTHYLMKILMEKGFSFTTTAEREIVRDIKESLGVCLSSPWQEFDESEYQVRTTGLAKQYELPDGQVIDIDYERFKVPEPLFSPCIVGQEAPGIHQIVYDAGLCCPSFLVPQLFSNIVIAGGSSLFPGLPERLEKEVKQLIDTPSTQRYFPHPIQKLQGEKTSCLFGRVPNDIFTLMTQYLRPTTKVIAPPQRNFSAYAGGSILAGLEWFKDAWLTKEEYEERGPNMVNIKCY